MLTLKLHFDGEKIFVPDELRGHAPVDLIAMIDGSTADPNGVGGRSWRDSIGAGTPKTREQLAQTLRLMREGRDDE